MLIYKNNYGFNEKSVCALGFFDGVHMGHREIIKKARETANAKGEKLIVYTFDIHPLTYLKNEQTRLIYDNDTKIRVFEELNVDAVIFDSFPNVKDLSKEDFVKSILIDKLNVSDAVVGYNYRYGKCAEGNSENLKEELKKYDRNLFVEKEVMLDGDSVSSTRIRDYLMCGEIEKANKMLCKNLSYEYEVIHGMALAGDLGFPTVNGKINKDRLLPKYGVYGSNTYVDGICCKSITNIGVKPTVGTAFEPVIESHIIGIDSDLYGKKVKTEILYRIRDEKKFDSIEELKKQVLSDIEDRKNYDF